MGRWYADNDWYRLIKKVVGKGGLGHLTTLLELAPVTKEQVWPVLMSPALKANRWGVVRALINDFGVPADMWNGRVLKWACRVGNFAIVRWLICVQHVDPNLQQGRALLSARWNGHDEIANWLVEEGGVNTEKCFYEGGRIQSRSSPCTHGCSLCRGRPIYYRVIYRNWEE